MTDRELFAQAVVALEYHTQQTRSISNTNLAIEALRARLAQPEPLPAKSKGALSHEENKQHNKKILDKFYEENAHLYTAPPQREWQGLTDEEIREFEIWLDNDEEEHGWNPPPRKTLLNILKPNFGRKTEYETHLPALRWRMSTRQGLPCT